MILNASKFLLQVTTTRSVSATAAVAIMAVYYSGDGRKAQKWRGREKKKVGKLCEFGTRCGSTPAVEKKAWPGLKSSAVDMHPRGSDCSRRVRCA